jgi:hypothetical protein
MNWLIYRKSLSVLSALALKNQRLCKPYRAWRRFSYSNMLGLSVSNVFFKASKYGGALFCRYIRESGSFKTDVNRLDNGLRGNIVVCADQTAPLSL